MSDTLNSKFVLIAASLLKTIIHRDISYRTDSGAIKGLAGIINDYIDSHEFFTEVKKVLKEENDALTNPYTNLIKKSSELNEKAEKINSVNTGAELLLKPVSLFVELDKPAPGQEYYYKPGVLSLNNIFPSEAGSPEFNDRSENQFREVCTQFEKDLNNIPLTSLAAFCETLTEVYEKNFSFVASSGDTGMTGVSLYDYARVVTALTCCYSEAEYSDKPFLAVTADLTGIQNFIYSDNPVIENSARGMNKRVRGKSFFLSLITDSLADRILEDTGLSKANLIMNGGGHFIILAPNNESNKQYLLNLEKNVQKWFYNNLKGELNVVFSVTEIGEDLYTSFPEWYNSVSASLVKAKRQKGLRNLTDIFGYDLDSPDFREFSAYLDETEKMQYESLNEGYEKNTFRLSKFFQAIGKKLPNTCYFVRISADDAVAAEIVKLARGEMFRVHPCGYVWYFAESGNEIKKLFEKMSMPACKGVKVVKINDTDFLSETESVAGVLSKKPVPDVAFGYKFIGNTAPKKSGGEVMEFEELARSFRFLKKKTAETGDANPAVWKMEKSAYPLLGYVRMDIDNLGSIFSIGLEREDAEENVKTLSRVVNLSREFNNFFNGYLNRIAERWDMYITYSGGDDLSAVGSWINCINFALDVRNELSKFTCGNKNITISGGIYLTKPNYPAGKASEKAGEAEDSAKKRFRDKNCISVFNRTFRWEQFEKYYDYALELDSVINHNEKDFAVAGISGAGKSDYSLYFDVDPKNEIKTGLLHFILTITRDMFEDSENENSEVKTIRINKFNILYKLKYHLARSPRNLTADKIMNPGSEGRKKTELLSRIINDTEMLEYLDNFIIPAAYNIYKYRSFKKTQE